MKMVMVVYNEVLDTDVMESLESCRIKGYTKTAGIFGKGAASGTHMGNDIWPGKNNMLHVVCDNREAEELIKNIKAIRARFGNEGIKAFVMAVEEIT